MQIKFDPNKDQINRRTHKLSLADAALIDFDGMKGFLDSRFPYGEDRFQGYGYIGSRLYVLAYTMRGDVLRAISLRKANRREVELYG